MRRPPRGSDAIGHDPLSCFSLTPTVYDLVRNLADVAPQHSAQSDAQLRAEVLAQLRVLERKLGK